MTGRVKRLAVKDAENSESGAVISSEFEPPAELGGFAKASAGGEISLIIREKSTEKSKVNDRARGRRRWGAFFGR